MQECIRLAEITDSYFTEFSVPFLIIFRTAPGYSASWVLSFDITPVTLKKYVKEKNIQKRREIWIVVKPQKIYNRTKALFFDYLLVLLYLILHIFLWDSLFFVRHYLILRQFFVHQGRQKKPLVRCGRRGTRPPVLSAQHGPGRQWRLIKYMKSLALAKKHIFRNNHGRINKWT